MTDIPTPAKALTLQTVGGNNNTWGTINNTNFSTVDKALGGLLNKAITGNVALTSAEAQNLGYVFTGALSAVATATWPAYSGLLFVANNTTGGFALTATLGGAGVEIQPGERAFIHSDGADFVRVSRYSAGVFDSRPIVAAPSLIGGFFSDLDSKAAQKISYAEGENLSSFSATGAIRDTLFVNHIDSDTLAYGAANNTATAIRGVSAGPFSAGVFQSGYRNIVGIWGQGEGKSGNSATGVSSFLGNAIQHGAGICDNEFWVTNPVGAIQATSMCAGQFILQGLVAVADGSHLVRGIIIQNRGYLAGAGLYMTSGPPDAGDGKFACGIDMSQVVISTGGVAGIFMPASTGTGIEGSIIAYDTGDYSSFNHVSDYFEWTLGNVSAAVIGEGAVALGGASLGAARLALHTTDATKAAILFGAASAAPSSPTDGMLWYEGGALKFRTAGATKTITLA